MAFFYQQDGAWISINWRDFHRRAEKLARSLAGVGLVPGDHVGILAPTGLAWELLHHAVQIAGGVVVGLEPHDTGERLQYIADHAQLRLLAVQDEKLLGKLSPSQISGLRAVAMVECSNQRGSGGNIVALSALEEAEPVPRCMPDVVPNAAATLIYTSGTTGQPKGILYRHEQVVLAVRAIARAYPSITVGSRFVCWLPLSNLFQRIMNLAAMSVGGTTYLVGNPLTVMQALPAARPEVFIGVPRFYEKLHEGILQQIARMPPWMRSVVNSALAVGDRVARQRRAGSTPFVGTALMHRLADLLVLRKLRAVMGGRTRFMITGSAPTPVRLLEFFDAIGLPLYEAYGLSENVVPMALNRPHECKLGTVGKPLGENSMRIADDGELLVKGKGVFEGYWKDPRPDLFTGDGFYRTGDYATIDSGGFLQLIGRKSEIFKTSTGRRVSPISIEAALQEVASIDRAVVVGSGRKCLAAILSLRQDGPEESTAKDGGMPAGAKSGSVSAIPPSLAPALERAVQRLSPHERPAGFLLVERAFSIERGELTSNLKLRRQAIERNFASDLEGLYRQIDAGCDNPPLVLALTDRAPAH